MSHRFRKATLAGLGVVLTATCVAPAAAAPAALPPKSIKHTSTYWTWFGPRNWVAVTGAYGITISAPDGRTVDYGFSSTVCASAATEAGSVQAYYAQQRATLRASVGGQWRRATLSASRVRQLPSSDYGPKYYRQVMTFAGRSGGQAWRGEAIYDYSLASGPTYCFARNQSRVAPAAGFAASMRQLRSVQAGLAYFGPGAPGETPEVLPPR